MNTTTTVKIVTYHRATASDIGASAPHPGKNHATKATVADLLQNLESVFKCHPIDGLGGPSTGHVVCYCHVEKLICEFGMKIVSLSDPRLNGIPIRVLKLADNTTLDALRRDELQASKRRS